MRQASHGCKPVGMFTLFPLASPIKTPLKSNESLLRGDGKMMIYLTERNAPKALGTSPKIRLTFGFWLVAEVF